jgi:hypothetical protein
MRNRWNRRLATTLLATLLASTGCGYILHPERRGNNGGEISGGSLVLDLLWLIPGVVPGVVALVVDFSSGAIYTGRGDRMAAVTIPVDGRVAVQLPKSSQATQVEIRLITSAQRVVARTTAQVGPQLPGQTVELQLASPRPSPDETIYLEVSANGASARFPTAMHVTR